MNAEYLFFLDVRDSKSKLDDRVVLREKLSAIRQWLKDQYILYRDYCSMVQTINAHYVPTTLQDAKKVGAFLFDSSMLRMLISNGLVDS